ncbi:hypothetical protein AOLI_G00013730 [Acnodon oligacanthus]
MDNLATEVTTQTGTEVMTQTDVTTSTAAPTYQSLAISSGSDPCYSYTVLDEPWRATNYSDITNVRCDQYVSWVGWYRLKYYGQDVRMPESCVTMLMCGTHAPLWINGAHPQLQDGVVTRQICGHWNNDCCYFRSNPIRVKTCPGNFYVYEFVRPSSCMLAYCADAATAQEPMNIQPLPEHVVALRMRVSSANNLEQLPSREAFLNELKEVLIRKGLPSNFTLHLNKVSKWIDGN